MLDVSLQVTLQITGAKKHLTLFGVLALLYILCTSLTFGYIVLMLG